jgi:periplasmic divalent cation tolerance protein
MTDKIVILSTCGSAEEAEKIAGRLVEAQVAACVNIVPGIRSVYGWKGAVERATEWLLLIKTRQELFGRVAAEVRKLHSYQVPELIALPVTAGSENYLAWLDGEVKL